MPRKFRLGQTVNYRPASRAQGAARGTYAVTGLLPENDGQFEYRIKNSSEAYERVALESELSAV